MPIDLYQTPASAPCRMVLMVMKKLSIKHNVKNIDLAKGEQMKPEFISINPFHKVPVIIDDEITLRESRTIMRYLVDKYANDDKLYPKDFMKRMQVDQWLDFDLGSHSAAIGLLVYPIVFKGQPKDAEREKIVNDNLSVLDGLLKNTNFICGPDLTVADISIALSTHFMEMIDHDISPYKNIQSWMGRVRNELPWDEVNKGFYVTKTMLEEWRKSRGGSK